jgi:hypothetical protein
MTAWESVEEAIRRLAEPDGYRFAADCAEHVLPLFETVRPGDTRVRDGIAVLRRQAVEEVPFAEHNAAREAASAAAQDAQSNPDYQLAAGEVALAVAWALGPMATGPEAAQAAAMQAGGAAAVTAEADEDELDAAMDAARDAEHEWQLARLREYLR